MTAPIRLEVRGYRIVVEFRGRPPYEQRRRITEDVVHWRDHPETPLILEDGARIRTIRADGTVTPADDIDSVAARVARLVSAIAVGAMLALAIACVAQLAGLTNPAIVGAAAGAAWAAGWAQRPPR